MELMVPADPANLDSDSKVTVIVKSGLTISSVTVHDHSLGSEYVYFCGCLLVIHTASSTNTIRYIFCLDSASNRLDKCGFLIQPTRHRRQSKTSTENSCH